jgi:hypothetical protein
MWGVPGAILAVPMLAIVKIISDRVRPLKAFGHFIEGEEREGKAAEASHAVRICGHSFI